MWNWARRNARTYARGISEVRVDAATGASSRLVARIQGAPGLQSFVGPSGSDRRIYYVRERILGSSGGTVHSIGHARYAYDLRTRGITRSAALPMAPIASLAVDDATAIYGTAGERWNAADSEAAVLAAQG